MIQSSFNHFNHSIPYEKGEGKPLNNAHGFARPGKVTALMGSSGAGETNTLAQWANSGLVSLWYPETFWFMGDLYREIPPSYGP